MGGRRSQTVGYWYHPVFQLVLGRGPVDAILRVRGSDVDAWTGELTASGAIAINNPELWGGESSEGGIVGDLVAFMGDAAQAPIAFVSEQLGPDPSAHRGQLSMVFTGGRFGAMNPYPKPLSVMVRRILEGWELAGGACWYSATAPIPFGTTEGLVFSETFATLTPYSVISGNGALFTLSSTSFGGTLSIASQTSGTQAIVRRSITVSGTPRRLDVAFRLRGSGQGDDAGLLYIRAGSTVLFAFNPRRDVLFDDARRPLIQFGLSTQFIGSALPDNVWHALEVTWDDSTEVWVATIRTASTGAVVATVSGFSASFLGGADNLQFVSDSGDATVPVDYAALRLTTIGALQALNPAHALYYSLVADSMQGEPAAYVNESSFQAAADLFFDEALGICTEWDSDKETIEQFRARICEAVGARMSRSTVDGQWYLDVMRGQYELASLPILTDDDILDFEAEPAVLDDAVNQVAVQWFDPLTKQERTTAPLQALGAIDAGGVNAQTLSYSCLPTESLALRIAARELRARATPLWRFKLITNRKPYSWRTGTYFRLQAAKRGIADMVCLVGDIEKGTLRSGAISITAVQDVYAMPATTYVEAQPPIEPPSSTPVPVVEQLAFEAPYVELVQQMSAADLAALADDAGYLATVGARPEVGINYELNTRPGAGDYAAAGYFDWCPTATVVEAADKVDTAFTLDDTSLLDRVAVGTAALWGDEIVRVDALDTDASTITLARGCADTVPQLHAAGERIWFYDAWSGTDQVEYVDGETADAKLRTRTGTAILPLTDAPVASVEFSSRQARPYPPADLQIEGLVWPSSLPSGSIDLGWAHRDRLLQADQLVDTTEADVGPEAGTTYSARVVRTDTEAELDAVSGVSGTSTTLVAAYTGGVRLELWSVRDGLESWQRHRHVMALGDSGALIAEDNDPLVTEAGDALAME